MFGRRHVLPVVTEFLDRHPDAYQVADDLSSGALVRLLRDFEPPARPVHIVVLGSRHRAPRVRALVEHVTEQLRALPVVAGGSDR